METLQDPNIKYFISDYTVMNGYKELTTEQQGMFQSIANSENAKIAVKRIKQYNEANAELFHTMVGQISPVALQKVEIFVRATNVL